MKPGLDKFHVIGIDRKCFSLFRLLSKGTLLKLEKQRKKKQNKFWRIIAPGGSPCSVVKFAYYKHSKNANCLLIKIIEPSTLDS